MKVITSFFALMFISFISFQCSPPGRVLEPLVYEEQNQEIVGENIQLYLNNGTAFNHPSYVIWLENMQGDFIKTLFITKSYASGIFGHQMVGDSIWLPTSGVSYQPAALPYWTHKKGLINGKSMVPTPETPYTDAFSGATPKQDLILNTSVAIEKPYKIQMEVNQAWDWNDHWTNNKYPDNPAYKHSAQPSIIYTVSINDQQNQYFLNPIGHGDPKGKSGQLYTNISTLSSAKNIFKSIEIKFNK